MPKNLRSLFLTTLALLAFLDARGQEIDDNVYRHKMQLMDSLSFYKMQDYDALYHISVLYKNYGRADTIGYYGWINRQNKEDILFLEVKGTAFDISREQLLTISRLPLNKKTIEDFLGEQRKNTLFAIGDFGSDYLLTLWLYKKGEIGYSKQLLPKNDRFFSDSSLRDNFGIIYYDDMLSAFSHQRNFTEAIVFGNHLSKKVFNGYPYQKEAAALTRQLKSDIGDFKTFRLPDSLEWSSLNQRLSRNQQIIYLAERLRLLNCIQPGQPGGIGYSMYQFSIPYSEAQHLKISYWDYSPKYTVINPYVELIKMNLNPHEVEILLPYLLTDTYIPSYSYFRDFRPNRTLHKLSWVAEDLIFEITDRSFFDSRYFYGLTLAQKNAEIEKIKQWCDENVGLSKEERTIKILKTDTGWTNFHKAMETAKAAKYNGLLPIIVQRYNDFNKTYWPVQREAMTETMYEIGNEKYINVVREWNKDTTNMEINLWTTLFLIKYDKDSYEPAMAELAAILKQDDGSFYYPRAMDLLLSLNDKKALKLADGILTKQMFPIYVSWDYYLNFIKKLLLLKNDYTFNFINSKISEFPPDEIKSFNGNKNANFLTTSDEFVVAVDKLRNNDNGYMSQVNFATMETRLAYRKALSKWFETQYQLLKDGKPNELHLNIVQTGAPVGFVDAP